jgi:hypothetical protein
MSGDKVRVAILSNISMSLIFLGWLVLVGSLLVKDVMPRVEGKWFPVITPAQLSDPMNDPPPSFRNIWSAQAEKLRDCTYVLGSLTWYLGTPARHQQVNSYFKDKPQVRPPGELLWNSLVIELDVGQVRAQSYATVRHRCPGRPWEVESLFFMSSQISIYD